MSEEIAVLRLELARLKKRLNDAAHKTSLQQQSVTNQVMEMKLLLAKAEGVFEQALAQINRSQVVVNSSSNSNSENSVHSNVDASRKTNGMPAWLIGVALVIIAALAGVTVKSKWFTAEPKNDPVPHRIDTE